MQAGGGNEHGVPSGWRHRALAALLVDGNVGERGLSDLDRDPRGRAAQPAFRPDLDIDGDRGGADLCHFGAKAHHVGDEHRFLEVEGVDRHGHDPAFRALAGDDGAFTNRMHPVTGPDWAKLQDYLMDQLCFPVTIMWPNWPDYEFTHIST